MRALWDQRQERAVAVTAAQEILSAYDDNLNAVFSINELSRRIGKAYPSVHKSVQTLVERGVLTRTEVGRSHLCGINLENSQAIMLLALNEVAKHDTVPSSVLAEVKKLDTGIDTLQIASAVYNPATEETLLITASTETPADGFVVLTPVQLKERLLEDEEFYREHIVIRGFEHFFRVLADPSIQRRYHPLL